MIKKFNDIKGFNRIFDQLKTPRENGPAEVRLQDQRPAGRLSSLLEAVCEQAVSLQCEQERASANVRQELELLTSRMAMLAPLCEKNIEALLLDETRIEELDRQAAERRQQLDAAETEVALYRPLAARLEEELRSERAELDMARRTHTKLAEDLQKMGAENNLLAHRAASFEAKWQRLVEHNEIQSEDIDAKERAIEKLTREAMMHQSDFASHASDLERCNTDIETLNDELNSSCKENLALRGEVRELKVALARTQQEQRVHMEELNATLINAREQLSNCEEQTIELENANTALRSQVEFLTRAGEQQREEVSRHLQHIGQLDASNRHLFDMLTRSASAFDFENVMPTVPERPKRGQIALRAVRSAGKEVPA